MAQYPPRHLVTSLNVSGTTVRRWSELYHRHLSPFATVAPRRYTSADVAVMTRIKALSDSGMRIEEIDKLLDQAEPLPPTEPPTEPQDAPTTALTTFTALVAQIAVLNERVTRLERAAHKHTGMVKGTPID